MVGNANFSAKTRLNAKILQHLKKGPRWVIIMKKGGKNLVTMMILYRLNF